MSIEYIDIPFSLNPKAFVPDACQDMARDNSFSTASKTQARIILQTRLGVLLLLQG